MIATIRRVAIGIGRALTSTQRTRIGEHVGSHASLVGSCGATMSDERPCAMLAP